MRIVHKEKGYLYFDTKRDCLNYLKMGLSKRDILFFSRKCEDNKPTYVGSVWIKRRLHTVLFDLAPGCIVTKIQFEDDGEIMGDELYSKCYSRYSKQIQEIKETLSCVYYLGD